MVPSACVQERFSMTKTAKNNANGVGKYALGVLTGAGVATGTNILNSFLGVDDAAAYAREKGRIARRKAIEKTKNTWEQAATKVKQ